MMLGGCGGNGGGAAPAAILLQNENNYRATGKLSLPTVETAVGGGLGHRRTEMTTDIQCHEVAPKVDIYTSRCFGSASHEAQVEQKLTAGHAGAVGGLRLPRIPHRPRVDLYQALQLLVPGNVREGVGRVPGTSGGDLHAAVHPRDQDRPRRAHDDVHQADRNLDQHQGRCAARLWAASTSR